MSFVFLDQEIIDVKIRMQSNGGEEAAAIRQ